MKSKIRLSNEIEFGPHSFEGAKTYIKYRFGNDPETYSLRFGSSIEEGNNALYIASKMLCFSDYSEETIEEIVVQGWRVEYIGWQPGMLYEFKDAETDEIIWSRAFPNWDH